MELVKTNLEAMIEVLLDHILRTSPHTAQSGVRLFVYNVVEQVMLDLFGKEIIAESLDAHIAKLFDIDAAHGGFLNLLVAASLLWRLL